ARQPATPSKPPVPLAGGFLFPQGKGGRPARRTLLFNTLIILKVHYNTLGRRASAANNRITPGNRRRTRPGSWPSRWRVSFSMSKVMAKATKAAVEVVNDGAAAQAPPKDAQAPEPKQGPADLAGLAQQLEALTAEATRLGEEQVAKRIGYAAK